ncbi:helicase ARIP4-like [Diadema antillarum]|uniref:helicase ARIP4-like n=1 Tax=Diadema antillarum TaxID=105358 RepID=UPI003A89923D
MSENHPISESESDSEEFLPPGLQSDASYDSEGSNPEPDNKASSIDDDPASRPSSTTPSLMEDEYTFKDPPEDALLTQSFVSMPEGLEPPGAGPESNSSGSKKRAAKRRRQKSGTEAGPRRRKRKAKKAAEEDEEEEEEEKEGEENGEGTRKKKGKSKGKNKPANRRRNIKSFLREDQLDTETLNAQREEEERKKRLEEERKRRMDEQKSQKTKAASGPAETLEEALAAVSATIHTLAQSSEEAKPGASSTDIPSSSAPSSSTSATAAVAATAAAVPTNSECILVDSGSESERDANKTSKPENEVITISSDEEVTLVSDNSDEEADMDEGSSGMHTNDEANVPDAQGLILVNVNHPPDEPDIFLPDHIVRVVKPHQVGGIRFLYDNLVESLGRFRSSSGFGCILAHSMGLGKTLQCISFISIFMKHTQAHTVLCIVPINTLQNWLAEFDMWCPEKDRHFNVFVLNDSHKTTASRARVIGEWQERGGVLLMGYEMYRLLARSKQTAVGRPKKRSNKSGKSSPQVIDIDEMEAAADMAIDMKNALCNPGPDMVVCDEGHRIKNSHAGISQALKNIKTRRRVVLTGYPLQNNLQEYWCMVDFVRPNFLGTRHEFANLFERPISNGQCIDSTPYDVRLMRYRAHVLHSLLGGFVQRRGFNVLLSTLPPKEEHVLLVRLTSFQRGLYIRFMQCFKEAGAGGWCSANPLKAFSVGCKIWNHPDILGDLLTERESLGEDLDADLDLPEIQAKCKQKGGKKPADPKQGEASVSRMDTHGYQDKIQQIISFEWARPIMKNYTKNNLCNGGKMIVLFHILEESIRLGDRVLVFSQSLSTLSLIEKFLAQSSIPQPPNPPPLMPREWVRNKTYFRLDGSTAVSEREKMINQFNSRDNKAIWLFLLSTKAGCLGINLIGANRVVVMDASWNPCHDAQAVCRVYRYGQAKKCHVYRLVSDQTLEKKIYDRQISKKGMSDRVVDEMNPEMNLTKKEVESLLEFDETDMPFEDFSHLAKDIGDVILKSLVIKHSNFITKAPFTTESLLWDRKDQKLTRAEKMQAKKSYEEEKKLNLSYSRPSYAAFYPKGAGPQGALPIPPAKGVQNPGFNTGPPYPYMNTLKQPLQRPVANVRPIQSTPVPRQPPTSMDLTQKRLQNLKNAGVTLQRIVATTDIVLPGANTSSDSTPTIRAGEAVTFIKTKKGIYLRTHEGKILAVRGPNGGPGSLSAVAQGAFSDQRSASAGFAGGGGGPQTPPGESDWGSAQSTQSGSGLANSQLGQLLSQSVSPSQQFNNPPLPVISDKSTPPNQSPGANSPFFAFSQSQSNSLPRDYASASSSSLSFSSQPSLSTPYSLCNSSTLTMATDTTMHSSVIGTSSGTMTEMRRFPPYPQTSSIQQSDMPMPFQDMSPSPSSSGGMAFPPYSDQPWRNSNPGTVSTSQASASLDQSSLSFSENSGSGVMDQSNPSPFSLSDGPQLDSDFLPPSSESLPPSSMGAAQSVQLAPSLPFPQNTDPKFPSFPNLGGSGNASSSSNSQSASSSPSLGNESDISNLTRFVDSSFPNLMPFSGSLNPDGNVQPNAGLP